MRRLLLFVAALLSTAAPARAAADDPTVSRAEFNAVEVGYRHSYVDRLFDTDGTLKGSWSGDDGLNYQRWWYPTYEGAGTHVRVIYADVAGDGFLEWTVTETDPHAVDPAGEGNPSWCVIRDSARSGRSGFFGSFDCFDHPYP